MKGFGFGGILEIGCLGELEEAAPTRVYAMFLATPRPSRDNMGLSGRPDHSRTKVEIQAQVGRSVVESGNTVETLCDSPNFN